MGRTKSAAAPKFKIPKRISLVICVLVLLLSVWAYRVQTRGQLLPVGSVAPDFTGIIGNHKVVHLSELLKTDRVVLVFYPGDGTAVCTSQLCALRDSISELGALHCVVLGINPASEAKHAQFARDYRFPFHLVSDTGSQIAIAYGCSGLLGINRRTVYIINRDRTVMLAERGVPKVADMLRVLEAVQ